MKIALTYNLKTADTEEQAEFDSLDTVTAIRYALIDLGHYVEPINGLSLLIKKMANHCSVPDLVFNIAEGTNGNGREATIPAILDEYRIPYTFSDPLTLCLCLNKASAKAVLRDSNIPVPTNGNLKDLPIFIKPIADGSSKGIDKRSLISSVEKFEQASKSVNGLHLIEEYLPGREFTVGILGTGSKAKSIGAMEIILKGHDSYSYEAKQNYKTDVEYQLPDDQIAKDAEEIAIKAYRALSLRDAGRIDLRCNKHGLPKVIDVNPLPGLNPESSDMCILARMRGISYEDLISKILDSAMERIM